MDLVKVAADVGVTLSVKKYRTAQELLEVFKKASGLDPALWDEIEPQWQDDLRRDSEFQELKSKCAAYLMEKKREDRNCPLLFAKALPYVKVSTVVGDLPISQVFVSVPKNKDALYVWRFTQKWEQFPSAVQQGYLTDRCQDLVQIILGPGLHQQLEMHGMFGTAVNHMIRTSLYAPSFINSLDSNHSLVLFEDGMALHRDTKD